MNNNLIIVIVVAIFLIGILSGGMYFALNKKSKESQKMPTSEIQVKNETEKVLSIEEKVVTSTQPSKSTSSQAATITNTSPCHIINDKRGCARNDFKILTPNGGEQLCVFEEFDITWKVPKDVDVITVTLREGGLSGFQYVIGSYPGSYNEEGLVNGEGKVMWRIPGVKEGMIYEMWINSAYKGSSVNDVSDRMFSIMNCRG